MSNLASRQLSRRDGSSSQPGTGGFDQGGTTDWVALSNTVFKFSFDVLGRLSQAEVEALTLQASLFMFRNVNISAEGERRIEDAVDKLGSHPSYTKALWFGFGYRHIIHDIRKTREGLSCIAICAALTEMYSVSFSGQVLRELFLLQGPPPDMTPALRQWSSIVDVCAGVLVPTEFGLMLSRCSKTYLHEGVDAGFRLPTQPQVIAKTLSSLFAVANHELDALQISGGADCAWLAVVAHWIFGLSVEIHDSNGNVIYRPDNPELGTSVAQKAQIIIHQGMGLNSPGQIVRSLHVLPSGARSFIHQAYMGNSGPSMVEVLSYGRPPWETCLVDSFGPRMKVLLEKHGDTLGRYLGVSSRVFASRRGEPDPVRGSLHDSDPWDTPLFRLITDFDIPIGPASSTSGFCSAVRGLFPELGNSHLITSAMESSSALGATAARLRYPHSMVALCKICDCDFCQNYKSPHWERRPSSLNRPNDCFFAMGIVIRKLVHMLSNSVNHHEDQLRPTAAGMMLHLAIHEAYPIRELRQEILEKSYFVRGFSTQLSPLQHIHLIFGGRHIRDRGDDHRQLALSNNGLVVYHETLCDISSDPELVGNFCVMAGGIEWRKMRYTKIVSEPPEHKPAYNAIIRGPIDDLASFTVPEVSSDSLVAHLILEEQGSGNDPTLNTLAAYYTIERTGEPKSRFRVDPLDIIADVQRATSLEGQCTGPSRYCRSIEGNEGILVEGEGHIDKDSLPPSSGFPPIIRVLPPSSLAVWVALAQQWTDSDRYVDFITRICMTDCLGCCLSRVLERQYRLRKIDPFWKGKQGIPEDRDILDEDGSFAEMSRSLKVRLICLVCPAGGNFLPGP